ncbi:unnamed protein product, partial [Rotaria magnacalcarata]
MSSITFVPRATTTTSYQGPSYSAATTANLPNINIPPMRPAYLNPNPVPRPIQPTYQQLNQQVQRKPALYGAGQRKYNPFHKFQTGTTTTFNGYTNITGAHQANIPPRPAPRRFIPQQQQPSCQYPQHQYPQQNYNNYNKIITIIIQTTYQLYSTLTHFIYHLNSIPDRSNMPNNTIQINNISITHVQCPAQDSMYYR